MDLFFSLPNIPFVYFLWWLVVTCSGNRKEWGRKGGRKKKKRRLQWFKLGSLEGTGVFKYSRTRPRVVYLEIEISKIRERVFGRYHGLWISYLKNESHRKFREELLSKDGKFRRTRDQFVLTTEEYRSRIKRRMTWKWVRPSWMMDLIKGIVDGRVKGKNLHF